MGDAKQKLKWNITLVITEYWGLPDISDIEFDGDGVVSQNSYANGLSTKQVLDIMEEYCMDENGNTIGLLYGGLMMDALIVNNGDEDKKMWIAPYYPDKLAEVLKNIQLEEVPVLQDNMQDVKTELMDIESSIWSKQEWDSIVKEIEIVQKSGINYGSEERQEQADRFDKKIAKIRSNHD